MEIFGLEKLSLVDYNNIPCAVVFTGGCNFRCPFCHNSGLVDKKVEPLNMVEVMEFLRKRYGLLEAVCVSGGEPTLQPDLLEFLGKIKDIGYKVKLDTNGTNPTMLAEAIERKLVDYVAMDIKSCYAKYNIATGLTKIDLNNIKASIDILKSGVVDYEFRTTIVNELHGKDDIEAMAKELQGAKRIYLQRFVDTDTCIASGFNAVDKAIAEKWLEILSLNIQEAYLRGYV